ncbi:hypothetical protein [Nocardioides lianchengensis]|uniref:Uncharacterized protein n=1 Tax=Nocardioides lianchengensis TaxID=1045774 RepID=A0A1G6UY46_9ACTN|nr:hypothetical protein [Nocardioides lianchengensis]NYG11056.1 hypothetical protein [Nocardioides lianchengensis]SDD45545.1 hypothetical protein SAMN05421872_108109 [Nocardioides lianchengensis]
MSPEVTYAVVGVLTGLAAVVVVLTRLRLRRAEVAGRLEVGPALLNLHTGAGVLALVAWVAFLLAPESHPLGGSLVGLAAVGLWWLVALAGLLILVRWLPSRGRHAAEERTDSWSSGPGLSVLAHVGMVVGVGVFTWAYLFQKV